MAKLITVVRQLRKERDRVMRLAPLMLFGILGTAQSAKQPTLYVGPPDKGEGDAHIVLKQAIQDLGVRVTLVAIEPADFGSTYSFTPDPYVSKNNENRVRCTFAVSIYRESDAVEIFSHVGHGETADKHSCLERAAWDVALRLREHFTQ